MTFFRTIPNLFRFNKRNWKAVLFSILAAMIFWFFNALNKNYSANINFPLVFDYNQAEFMPVKPLPEEVLINVSGLGWDLFRRSIGLKVPPIIIPLDRPGEVKKIVASSLSTLFAPQLEDLQINYVPTDTVYLDIEPIATRTVYLRIDSIGNFLRPGYGISSDPTIEPERIQARGPRKMVEALGDTVRIPLNDDDIDQPYSEVIDLNNANQLIAFDPPSVSVHVTVGRFVVMADSIPLSLLHVPRRAYPYMPAAKVHGTFRALEEKAANFEGDSLIAVLDLEGVSRGRRRLLPVIPKLPEGVELVSLDSVLVVF